VPVADLATRGITVAAAEVSQVLEKMGLRPLLKRRKNGGSEAGAARVAGAKAAVPVPDHDGPAPA
jgi:ABC-type Fe3+/spermidine/putrescine transport system ATPase subunit